MQIAIIDNYDSFTYNLAHMIKALGVQVAVLRNDRFDLADLEPFDKLVLSPGPGIPSEAGLLLQVITTYAGRKPMLGVCLGHQAIGQVFGARLENLAQVFHGVSTPGMLIGNDYLFQGLPGHISMGRYHSWVVSRQNFPACLEITALSDEGQIMGLKHRQLDIHGIQFHPESILTPDGGQIIKNFINHI